MQVLLYVLGGVVAWSVLIVLIVAFIAAGSRVSAEEMVGRADAARHQRTSEADDVLSQPAADVAEPAGRPDWVAAHWRRATSIADRLRTALAMSGAGSFAMDDGPQERFLIVDLTRGTQTMSVACRAANGQGIITDLRATAGVDGATLAAALGSGGVLETGHWNVLLESLRAWVTEVDRVAGGADRWTQVHRAAVRTLAA